VSIEDKVLIETRFGPLWSGKTEIAFRGGARTLRDVKRALDLAGEDVMPIDLHELTAGRSPSAFTTATTEGSSSSSATRTGDSRGVPGAHRGVAGGALL